MPYYTDEQIIKAREMDLLTYLRLHDPGELVHVSGNEYCTREHDSLKISNGKWNWWSRGFGGASALDYLVKAKEIPFLQAMGMILDTEGKSPSFFDVQRQEKQVEKRLLLPEKSSSNDQIIRYLTGRGIDREVIESCIREGLLYESLPYHNCIFVGYDHNQVPRYASFRATSPEKIMGEAAGSDKKYAFRIERGGSTIHVFESAIDLLSFATIMKQRTGEWRAEPMVSLGGVYASRRGTQLMKLSVALTKALDRHEEVGTIALHLDADFAGRNAAASIADQLHPYYRIRNEPPPIGKDCNDYDIMKHPAIDNTADGKAAPYIHGEAKDAGATIELVYDLELISDAAENAQVIELPDSDYVLLSEEDIEKEVNEGTA